MSRHVVAVVLLAATAAVLWPALASNPPTPAETAKTAAPNIEYVALGTAAFGPNNHGSYTWFIDVKSKQVVMCLVHSPQAAIECKRQAVPTS